MIHSYAPYETTDPSGDQMMPVAQTRAHVATTAVDGGQASLGETPVTAEKSIAESTAFSGIPLFRVSRSRVLLALNQLAVMSKNGVEIAEAVEIVAKNCRDQQLTDSLLRIHDSVNHGNSFSAAVASHGEYFPVTLAPMLVAAEASGEVPDTLDQACARLREELEMRGAILSAMIYPIILICASSVVMTALILGVLPQFSKVFASIGKPIPPSTAYLLALGDFCRQYWLIIFPSTAGSLALVIGLRNHSLVRRPLARLLMYGPFVRNAYRPLVAGRNFRTISAMVRGGVPLLQAIRLASTTTRDVYWQALLGNIEAKLIDGLSASSAMSQADFLPPEAAQMVATAERTGRIGEVLEDVGAFYEQEGARRIKRLVIAMEPIIILVMGVIVAGVVMSVMLPLLDVSTIQ